MSRATPSDNDSNFGVTEHALPASRWRRWMPHASLVLAVIAVLMSWQLWQKVSTMQEMLARQSADAGQLSMQANSLAKNAQELTQETAARVALLDARLSEVALQRSQLEDLMQSLSRSRDENLVVDIEAALRMAQVHFEARNYGSAIIAAQEVQMRDNTDIAAKNILAASGLRVASRALEALRSSNVTVAVTLEEARTVSNMIMGLPEPDQPPPPVPVGKSPKVAAPPPAPKFTPPPAPPVTKYFI